MGQVIAKRMRDEGADVLVAGRKEEELKRFATEIGGHYALCDLTNEADIKALADSAKSQMGGVNIAINATGLGFLKPFLENTKEELETMSALQLVGPFQFYQEMIKAMDDGGSIIQISSATATIMLPIWERRRPPTISYDVLPTNSAKKTFGRTASRPA